MSIQEPQTQYRGPEPVKLQLELLANRKGFKTGPYLRKYTTEHVVQERAIEILNTVGFDETMKRLDTATYPTNRNKHNSNEKLVHA